MNTKNSDFVYRFYRVRASTMATSHDLKNRKVGLSAKAVAELAVKPEKPITFHGTGHVCVVLTRAKKGEYKAAVSF